MSDLVFTWPDLKLLIAVRLPVTNNALESRAIYAVNTLERSSTGHVRGSEDIIVACS